MTSNYRGLANGAPVVEQIASYKKRRKMTLSQKELALLKARQAARRLARKQARNPARKRTHPEREPGPVITIDAGGYVRSNP